MKEHIGERKWTTGDTLVAIGGIGLLTGGLASIHEHKTVKPIQNNEIEKMGDHYGKTGMPSTEHLSKFTAEHNITLNKK